MVDQVDLFLQLQREASRRLAGAAYVRPREVLELAKDLEPDCLNDDRARNFLKALLARKDELQQIDDTAPLVTEIVFSEQLLDVLRWLPDGEAIPAAIEAIEEIKRQIISRETVESLKNNPLVAQLTARKRKLEEQAFRMGNNGQQPDIDYNPPPPDDPPGKDKIHLTDMGNARRFALQHAGKVLYTQAWGWLVWDGKRWSKDETGAVYRLARQTVKSLYRDAEDQIEKDKRLVKAIEEAVEREDREAEAKAIEERAKAREIAEAMLGWAKKSQGKARIDAMVSLAQSEPEMVARTSDFDNDPWLLNVQNGVLDLRTGELKPHDPGFKITKLAGASYFPDAKCPTWLNFLEKIFRGDQSLIAFLQRAAGYSLTGSTREQALFFLFGTGANGKSTFNGALQDMLGDYAMKSRAETLMVKRFDSIPEEIAQLVGVRFMLASELVEGQRLNESLVKDLTGGDKLRARLLHRNSFEFYPEAKCWLYGNHKPVIRGTDNGIWRRVNLIPFEVTIPEGERDPKLPEKLRQELDGILTWCVQGCLKWQETGLQPPEKVQAATAEFRVEQDILAAFLDECCIINSLATVTAGALYEAYDKWSKSSGLVPKSKIAFSRQMEERGFTTKGPDGKPRRDGAGRAYYTGIGLVDTATAE